MPGGAGSGDTIWSAEWEARRFFSVDVTIEIVTFAFAEWQRADRPGGRAVLSEGGARPAPVRSLSRDISGPRPVGNIVELQIQAASHPRSRQDGVVQTFLKSRRTARTLPMPLSKAIAILRQFTDKPLIHGAAKRAEYCPSPLKLNGFSVICSQGVAGSSPAAGTDRGGAAVASTHATDPPWSPPP